MSPTSYRTAPPRDGTRLNMTGVRRLLHDTTNQRMNEATIAALPKIHLHCHLEGTLQAQAFLDLSDRYGTSTRYHPGGESIDGPRSIDEVYRFADFREFLLLFAAVSRSLASPADYARLARDFVADASAQHVVYGELFISPSTWTFFHPELDVRETISAIVTELRRARDSDARFSLIVDLTRNFGAERALRTAELAASLTDLDVIGIGLGGDEARFPAELFIDAFAYARAQGLHTVAHAGEAAGAQSVRAAIEIGRGAHRSRRASARRSCRRRTLA
jgi:aminodeoxyfutalosine deaminase